MEIMIKLDKDIIESLNDGVNLTDCQYKNLVDAITKGTPIPKDNKCKWIHCDYRTIYPKEHDITFWMIPENRMNGLKYCPYCGKKIEIELIDKEE